MTLKEQWKRVKENWIIAVMVLAILLVPMFSGGNGISGLSKGYDEGMGAPEAAMMDSATASMRGGMYYGEDFAPEVTERKITKDAYLSTEVERGKFADAETKLKAIITASNSILLNENVNKYDIGWKTTYQGSYQIKVQGTKYAAVVEQLKGLGEVESFSENARDITGSYLNTQEQLELERERLARYQEMYAEVESVSEKIELSDRIFNQERTIKYLEEALKNKDRQIEYSTINVNLREKSSEWTGIAVAKFSQLIRSLVNSFNNLLSLIFWAVPWLVAIAVIWIGVRLVKKKKRK